MDAPVAAGQCQAAVKHIQEQDTVLPRIADMIICYASMPGTCIYILIVFIEINRFISDRKVYIKVQIAACSVDCIFYRVCVLCVPQERKCPNPGHCRSVYETCWERKYSEYDPNGT